MDESLSYGSHHISSPATVLHPPSVRIPPLHPASFPIRVEKKEREEKERKEEVEEGESETEEEYEGRGEQFDDDDRHGYDDDHVYDNGSLDNSIVGLSSQRLTPRIIPVRGMHGGTPDRSMRVDVHEDSGRIPFLGTSEGSRIRSYTPERSESDVSRNRSYSFSEEGRPDLAPELGLGISSEGPRHPVPSTSRSLAPLTSSIDYHPRGGSSAARRPSARRIPYEAPPTIHPNGIRGRLHEVAPAAISAPTVARKRKPLRRLIAKFDSRLIALLPSISEVSIEGFIAQVELLYTYDSHRLLAARSKLPEEYTYLLRGEEEYTWQGMKKALLSKAKRATSATITAFNRYTQMDTETINGSWDRLLQLARAADVRKSKFELWSYFKERLNQTSRLYFKEELKLDDPFVALPMIAGTGDVPVASKSTLLAYGIKDERKNKSEVKCWECGRMGHYARYCRTPKDGSSSGSKPVDQIPEKEKPYQRNFDNSRSNDRGWDKRKFNKNRKRYNKPGESRPFENGKSDKRDDVPKAPNKVEKPKADPDVVKLLTVFQPIGQAEAMTQNPPL